MNSDPANLDKLHDLVAPPPIPWWPPAPGWYWVLGALSIILATCVVRAFIHWQRNCYRREALAEWRKHAAQLVDADARLAALTELAVLLKRTALSTFPRVEIAFLTGPAWSAFLARTAVRKNDGANISELLERAAYGHIPITKLDERQAREAAAFVRHWIVRHRIGMNKEGGGC